MYFETTLNPKLGFYNSEVLIFHPHHNNHTSFLLPDLVQAQMFDLHKETSKGKNVFIYVKTLQILE